MDALALAVLHEGAGPRVPCDPQPLLAQAFVDGLSLHAGSQVNQNDRQGLERFGSRVPIGPECTGTISATPT
ncbi:MAG: hypothetical protein HY901_33500 [Deltaproteobacteria bacterium]|nr:hypothetical protein [Deltaproteobacteria bacterium]